MAASNTSTSFSLGKCYRCDRPTKRIFQCHGSPSERRQMTPVPRALQLRRMLRLACPSPPRRMLFKDLRRSRLSVSHQSHWSTAISRRLWRRPAGVLHELVTRGLQHPAGNAAVPGRTAARGARVRGRSRSRSRSRTLRATRTRALSCVTTRRASGSGPWAR